MHKIKQKAIALGVDAVAFLNLKDYQSPRSPDPVQYLEKAKSLVIYILRELRGGYMNQTIIRMASLGGLDQTEAYIGYNLARFIEDEFDEDSLIIPGHRPFEIDEDTYKSIIAPVSLRHAAELAGLGKIGRNGIVVNDKWGSMIRLGGILTTLEFKSDTPADYDLCKDCAYPCVEMCPAKAITIRNNHTIVDQAKCTRYSQPYDVTGLIYIWPVWVTCITSALNVPGDVLAAG
jgi:epoxyqueuosine reductase QueG